jgi:acetoacetyl-CoA synthetase
MTIEAGSLLRPAIDRSRWSDSRMGRFLDRIATREGITFATFEDAWQWSIDNLETFWADVVDEFDIILHSPYERILASRDMPGAEWLPGATLNYAENAVTALRERGDHRSLIARSQTNGAREWSANRLIEEVGRVQAGLRRAGVGVGDRVVAYLPNLPETVAVYLATASLGAIFCSIPPEMGPTSMIDRAGQLDPKVIIAVDGYVWGTKRVGRMDELERIREAITSAEYVVLPYMNPDVTIPEGVASYATFTADKVEPTFEPVPFDHPLVILFSSGTTGKPKAIVHSHGGMLLAHLRDIGLHFDINEKDVNFWYSTTGWMVWTLSVSNLLVGAAMVLMDGDPNYPSLDGEWSQWAVAAETGATYIATSSAYLAACAHAGMTPGSTWDLSHLREIQCSGSPLAADVAAWVYAEVSPTLTLTPASGGTDICSGFLMGSPLTAVYAGEMSCRPLGVATDSWDPNGHPIAGEPGELVCTQPLPNMPVYFWGDQNFERYRASYFDTYPGIWRHGDWLIRTPRDTWVITGRSDATLNRGGVRLGTAEFYAVLDPLPGVNDSMVMHFEDPDGGMGTLVLLVVASGDADRAELEKTIRTAIRTELSPRHVPDAIVFTESVPRTATGKRLEIPLKRVVQGMTGENVMDRSVLVNPQHVDDIVAAVRAVI